MDRRSFVGALGALGLASRGQSAEEKPTRFYAFHYYTLKSGSQPGRLHEFLSQSMLPALNRVHSGPKLFMDAIIAPHVPMVSAIFGFSSLEELWQTHSKIGADENLRKGMAALESGPEPAFESLETSIVAAADYSPEIQPDATIAPRVFELRVYHSPTWTTLAALHDRFRGPEIKIFHRSGIHPLFYGSTFVGQNLPNLVYLIPFTDLAAREKAWAAFGADPDWQKVRKESVEKYGEIVPEIQITFFKATSYSPVH